MPRTPAWALVLCCLGAHLAAADPRSAAVRTAAFPNGPTVLLAPDSLAGAAHVGVWFDAGSRNDPKGRSGLAYVVSRAALQPADEARRLLEAAGATFDLTVTSDVTSSSVTLPAEQLRAALDAELAMLQGPALTAASLRRALDGARAERSRRLAQNPLLPAIEGVCAAVYAGHGYAAPASGRDRDLDAITLDDARQDLATRFAPARCLVTVTGRFDADDALAVLTTRYGAPGRAAVAARPAAAFGSIEAHADAGTSRLPVPVVLGGWRLPPDRDPDSAALEVLARVLAGSPNARLERSLVAAGTPFLQIQGSFERRADGCLLVVAAALKSGFDTTKVESQLAAEVERLAHDPLPIAELEPAQRAVEADLLERAQSVGGRAEALAIADIADGDWRGWEQRIARVRTLTPADVQRAAAKALVPARRTLVWIAPSPESKGGSQ